MAYKRADKTIDSDYSNHGKKITRLKRDKEQKQ